MSKIINALRITFDTYRRYPMFIVLDIGIVLVAVGFLMMIFASGVIK